MELLEKSFHWAVSAGRAEDVESMLKNCPELVFSKDETGRTPLHVAAHHGHTSILKQLVASGADIHAKDSASMTPLRLAAGRGHKEAVQFLTKYAESDPEIQEPTPPMFKEVSLGKLDPPVLPETLRTSPNNNRVAYLAKSKNAHSIVVMDDQTVETYSYVYISGGSLTFSPDSKCVACVAEHGKWRAVVVVNGQEGKEYDDIAGDSLTFSPDSKRVAYIAGRRDGKVFAVVDGQEGKDYDHIASDSLTFSPDSKHVAYVGVSGCEKESLLGKWTARGGKSFLVVDGQENKAYENILNRVFFSPDSKRIAYVAGPEKRWFVVVDGQESKPYDCDGGFSQHFPVFSANSQRVAYAAQRGGKGFVVVDGLEGKAYRSTFGPVFSPDSRHLAYSACRERRQLSVIDGHEIGPYDLVGSFTFSPNSGRVAYAARRDEEGFLVLDGSERRADGCTFNSVGEIVFSPDSRRVAYLAQSGGNFLVVDGGQVSNAYHFAGGLTFSPNSRHLAYFAQHGGPIAGMFHSPSGRGKEWFIERDYQESDPYDIVFSRRSYSFRDWATHDLFAISGECLCALALRDGEFFRVDVRAANEKDGSGVQARPWSVFGRFHY